MRLADVERPLLEPTDAHSMGIYDLSKTAFDTDALRRLGVEDQFIPEIAPAGTTIGNTVEGIPVFVSVGDNQAGFVGSVRTCADSLLVSVGTSAQLSAFTPRLPETPDDGPAFPGWVGALETRPYPGGGFLLSGASIAGGSAYRMLETLFRTICQTYGAGDPGPILDKMNSINSAELHEHQRLTVSTQFLGTRRDPSKRGSITGIAPSNFTPEYLVDGFVRGIVAEVAGFYEDFRESTGHCSSATIGVGNALRRNALLRSILHTELNLPLFLPAQREETALGAAIIAGVGAGVFDSYTSPDRPVRYEGEADHVSM
jgi:sedoheptulokinase